MKLVIARLAASLCLFSVTLAILVSPSSSFAQRIQTAATKVAFQKRKISLGGQTLNVEIADTPLRRERGLMFRTSLDDKSGMLFIFDFEQPLAFWMKNTLIPLAIAYIDKDRKIVDIQEMVPAVMGQIQPPSYPSKKPAMYALEMPKGWFARKGVKIGARFSFVD
jgi:uncharacterized protein